MKQKVGVKVKNEKIFGLIESSGMSRVQFASRYGISIADLTKFQNGKDDFMFTTLWRFSKLMNVPITDLFEEVSVDLEKSNRYERLVIEQKKHYNGRF